MIHTFEAHGLAFSKFFLTSKFSKDIFIGHSYLLKKDKW